MRTLYTTMIEFARDFRGQFCGENVNLKYQTTTEWGGTEDMVGGENDMVWIFSGVSSGVVI